MWRELIAVLEEILQTYEHFLALEKQKRAALVAVDMEALEKLLTAQQPLLKQVENLERRRQFALRALIKAEAITAPQKKLPDLYAYCDAATGERLQALHAALKTMADALKQLRQANDLLAGNALPGLHYRMNVLSATSVEPTYAPEGGERVSAAKWLDFKA